MTKLYWLDNSTFGGRLAISSRPRGGDWLEDEIRHFKQQGIDTIVSVLTPLEINELQLEYEGHYCDSHHISYLSYPINDRQVPKSLGAFSEFTQKLSNLLSQEKNILIHCRQGIGRSSLIAAGVLSYHHNLSTYEIFKSIELCRGSTLPDTQEQINWLTNWMQSSKGNISMVDLFKSP
jgi:protein-tyrosine phosphatase